MRYSKSAHTRFYHRFHVVWATKYRYKVLGGSMRERVREIIIQTCNEQGVHLKAWGDCVFVLRLASILDVWNGQYYSTEDPLAGTQPQIWRRVLVPVSISLWELHGIIQVAMGWEGIHLYEFDIRAVRYGSFELFAANPDLPLAEFVFRQNEAFSYIYDMGDHWAHEIRIETFADLDPKKKYPNCTGGSGACPPEDCGGVKGYLYRREEADGYDAWQDMHSMIDLLSDATKPDAGEEVVREFLTNDVQMTMERVLACEPYKTAKFSRGDVNRAFRVDRHLELMRQQMW